MIIMVYQLNIPIQLLKIKITTQQSSSNNNDNKYGYYQNKNIIYFNNNNIINIIINCNGNNTNIFPSNININELIKLKYWMKMISVYNILLYLI